MLPRTSAIMPRSALRSAVAARLASASIMAVIALMNVAARGAASVNRSLLAGCSSAVWAISSTRCCAAANSSRTTLKSVHFSTFAGLVQLADRRSISPRMRAMSAQTAARCCLNEGLPVSIQPLRAARVLLMSFTRPALANAVGTRRSTMRVVRRSTLSTFHTVTPTAAASVRVMTANPRISWARILSLPVMCRIRFGACGSVTLSGSNKPAGSLLVSLAGIVSMLSTIIRPYVGVELCPTIHNLP